MDLTLYLLVPGARIELAQPYDRGILSPLRLPVPPSGHIFGMNFFSILPNGWQAANALKWMLKVAQGGPDNTGGNGGADDSGDIWRHGMHKEKISWIFLESDGMNNTGRVGNG